MKRYTILEHTSDIRLKLEASTLEELFAIALEGMTSIIKPDILVKKEAGQAVHETIKLSSSDGTALLIDFLSEVLTLGHINKAAYDTVTFTKLTETELQAKLSGVIVSSFDEDIKAVTYHEAYVKKNEAGRYESLIIFDL